MHKTGPFTNSGVSKFVKLVVVYIYNYIPHEIPSHAGTRDSTTRLVGTGYDTVTRARAGQVGPVKPDSGRIPRTMIRQCDRS